MAILNQQISDLYAIYNGDSSEAFRAIPNESVHMSVYSPPFAVETGGCLYNYSSSVRDLSNARTYAEFFEHYEYIVEQIARVTLPGRISAVHCTDVPKEGANPGGYSDFPGDIIRLHQKLGFEYLPRICIWKEPLEVRNRTLLKSLAHRTIVDDSTLSSCAASDYLIPFRKRGKNPIPVTHERGILEYAGATPIPKELSPLRGFSGKQTLNRYSHWIWRRYASSFWDDIRLDNVLEFEAARDEQDERHQHPLQLDVITRACELWSNPGEVVATPFMGVGSEVYGAVVNGRKGIGCELKPSYYNQAVKNLKLAENVLANAGKSSRQKTLSFEPDEQEQSQ